MVLFLRCFAQLSLSLSLSSHPLDYVLRRSTGFLVEGINDNTDFSRTHHEAGEPSKMTHFVLMTLAGPSHQV